MLNVFDTALDLFITVYLDDIHIFSENKEQHLERLHFALGKLREYSLKAKLKKSGFGLTTVEYLGHVINAGSIETDPSKVSTVREQPVPTDVKQLQSFLGLENCYNRFIRRFAPIFAPLTELLAKNIPFVWGQKQQDAFSELKDKLCTIPQIILQLPNFEYDFVLESDASAFALGATLMQDKGFGLQLVSYFSKKLNDAETRYSSHEVELLAIVQALEKFRPYVDSKHTMVRTDHNPLTYVNTQPSLSNKQIRWMQKLGRFNYTIEYKRGIANAAADTLKRRPYMSGTKSKFVHFADHKGQPLVSELFFHQDAPLTCQYDRIVISTCVKISTANSTKISTQVDNILVLIGIKTNDRKFIEWYLLKTKSPFNLDACLAKWVVDVQQTDATDPKTLQTDSSSIDSLFGTIVAHIHSQLPSQRDITKQDPKYENTPLNTFKPHLGWDITFN